MDKNIIDIYSDMANALTRMSEAMLSLSRYYDIKRDPENADNDSAETTVCNSGAESESPSPVKDPVYTLDFMRYVLGEAARSYKVKPKALISKYAEKISGVKESDYANIINDLKSEIGDENYKEIASKA